MEETFEKDFESELEALATLDEYQKEVEQLFQQRNENLHGLAAIRAKNAQIKLKSDLKRSTAFVKKIKALTSEAIGQCQKEVESLNLKLYISEIVTGLLTVTFKAVDVTNIAKLCVSLHHRYDDFLPPLLDGLKNSLINPLEDDADAGKKRRIQIRLVIELYQMGLFNDDQFFFNLLKNLLGKGKR